MDLHKITSSSLDIWTIVLFFIIHLIVYVFLIEKMSLLAHAEAGN